MDGHVNGFFKPHAQRAAQMQYTGPGRSPRGLTNENEQVRNRATSVLGGQGMGEHYNHFSSLRKLLT